MSPSLSITRVNLAGSTMPSTVDAHSENVLTSVDLWWSVHYLLAYTYLTKTNIRKLGYFVLKLLK